MATVPIVLDFKNCSDGRISHPDAHVDDRLKFLLLAATRERWLLGRAKQGIAHREE